MPPLLIDIVGVFRTIQKVGLLGLASGLGDYMTWIDQRCVVLLSGVILLVASQLKLLEVLTSESSVHADRLALSCLELAIAIILVISGQRVWLVATAVFITLLMVALFNVIRGVESCDCFGPIQTPPVAVVLLDGIVVSLLLYTRFHRKVINRADLSFSFRIAFVPLSLGLAMVLVVCSGNALKRTPGYKILPSELVLERRGPGRAAIKKELFNNLGVELKEIRLIPSCGCTQALVSKSILEPGGTLEVEFLVEGARADTAFSIPVLMEYLVDERTLSDLCTLSAPKPRGEDL